MKRRVLLWIMALTFALIGCQGESQNAEKQALVAEDQPKTELAQGVTSSEETEPVPVTEAVTEPEDQIRDLILWHAYTEPLEAELERLVDAFNKMETGVRVKVVRKEPAELTLVTEGMLQAEDAPDILLDFPMEAVRLQKAGLLVDMRVMVEDPENGIPGFQESMYAPYYQEAIQWDGGLYMIPLVKSGEVLYYNKTLYDAYGLTAPTTWAEMEENSRVLYYEHGVAGFGVESPIELVEMLIEQSGTTYVDPVNGQVAFNQPVLVEELRHFTDLIAEGLYVTPSIHGTLVSAFENGEVGSVMASTFYEDYFLGGELEFEMGVTTLPQGGVVNYSPTVGASAYLFRSDPEQEAAAFSFLKYFVSPQPNTDWVIAYGGVSPYSAPYQMEAYTNYLNANPARSVLYGAGPIVGYIPSVQGLIQARVILYPLLDQVATGVQTADSAVQSAQDAMNELIPK